MEDIALVEKNTNLNKNKFPLNLNIEKITSPRKERKNRTKNISAEKILAQFHFHYLHIKKFSCSFSLYLSSIFTFNLWGVVNEQKKLRVNE